MSDLIPFFIYLRAKKQSGEPNAVFWKSAKNESRALRDAENALEDADKDPTNYFKALVTNLHVVNELPPEGVISFTFCNFYQLGDDGKTWEQIPGVTLPPHPGEKVVEGTDKTIVDGVNIETGEVIEGTETIAGDVESGCDDNIQEEYADDESAEFQLATMPFRTQLLAQYTSEERHVYHISIPQRRRLSALEMDVDNHDVQDLLLAAGSIPEIKKYDMPALWKFTDANKKVFPADKRHELGLRIQFAKLWFETSHIDRGILVREWASGNRITEANRTPSGANAGGGNKTDRATPLTALTLEHEICLGILARAVEFDIYNVPLQVELQANSMMNKLEDKEFLATRELFMSMPGGLDYSRACIIATVKTTPEDLWENHVKHREYLNRVMTETDHAHPDELLVDIACGRSSMPIPMAPVAAGSDVENTASNEGEKPEVESTSDVQNQKTVSDEEPTGDAMCASEDDLVDGEETNTVVSNTEILSAAAPSLAEQVEPVAEVIEWPTLFEPGRYEDVPNEVYHSANGISSTMLKDARLSLMFYHGRHIAKTIPRQQSDALVFGSVTHGLVLEPEKFAEEFAVPAEMPKDVVSTTSDLVSIIKEYNASLPALMAPDDLKAWIEAYNNDLIPPLSLSGDAEEIGMLYVSLPDKFRRLPEDEKHTVTKMKACIKEYNESLPPLLKVSGTRDQLLDQIATVSPDLAKGERAKFIPYNTSGTKEVLTEIVRSIRPDIVTADDWHKQQEQSAAGKTTISLAMYEQAKNINEALQADKDASWLLNHPSRKSEISYFGFDEETGLEIRVRPDIEIRLPFEGICADLKTISIGYVRQDRIKERLHREIIERDYHLSAAMYCDVAGLDSFSWIFVNKDPGYHWVAVVEASPMMLDLGRKEYRRVLRQINDAMESNVWPAPISERYVDDLNDYDVRRLEALEAE